MKQGASPEGRPKRSRPATPKVKVKPTPEEPTVAEQPAFDDLNGRISRRAYEIYVQRTSRGPLDDWLDAEREILNHESPVRSF